MLVVKFILISSIFAFAVKGKLLMDDINVDANPDYLAVKASIDKLDGEPVVNVQIEMKKDVDDVKVKVALSAKIGGEFREIYPAKDFNPCDKDAVEDEFVKYALHQIEKFGNLTIACPMKAGFYVIENFKMDDDSKSKSFGVGHFRVDVTALADDVAAMTLRFAFHSE